MRAPLASLILIALLVPPARLTAQQPATTTTSVETEIATAPVELDGTVLFHVRGVSSVPAEERARLIHNRIVDAAGDRSMAEDSIHVTEGDGVSRIEAPGHLLMGVLDADARLEQVDRQALAAAHLYRIRQAIVTYRADRLTTAVEHDFLRALVATLCFVLALLVLRWFWGLMDRQVAARVQRHIHSVGIQSFEVIRAERIQAAMRGLLLTFRTVIVLGLALVYLWYVLAQFPWTRSASGGLAGFVLAPLTHIGTSVLLSIPSLVFLAVLYVVFRFVLKVIRLFFGAVGRGDVKLPRFDPAWATPTYNIIRIAVVAFALIIAYPYIPGSGSAAFQGVSLFVGIMFSLGSSSFISNVIAGYAMIYRRAFKVGDRIKVGDAVGIVREIRLQVTHLRSLKNEEIILPNSMLLSSEVLNYSSMAQADGVILHTEVGIGYDTSWQQTEAMLLQAAERMTDLGTEPRPYVLLKKLGDFAVTYELNVHCDNVPVMGRLLANLNRHILDVFNEYGVQIMTPAYEGDPMAPKVVPPGEWYTAPARKPPVS